MVLNFGNGDGVVWATCNCRVRAGRKPMGAAPDRAALAEKYNDPNSHVEPFGSSDEIRRWV